MLLTDALDFFAPSEISRMEIRKRPPSILRSWQGWHRFDDWNTEKAASRKTVSFSILPF
jgi:hypothetical protein